MNTDAHIVTDFRIDEIPSFLKFERGKKSSIDREIEEEVQRIKQKDNAGIKRDATIDFCLSDDCSTEASEPVDDFEAMAKRNNGENKRAKEMFRSFRKSLRDRFRKLSVRKSIKKIRNRNKNNKNGIEEIEEKPKPSGYSENNMSISRTGSINFHRASRKVKRSLRWTKSKKQRRRHTVLIGEEAEEYSPIGSPFLSKLLRKSGILSDRDSSPKGSPDEALKRGKSFKRISASSPLTRVRSQRLKPQINGPGAQRPRAKSNAFCEVVMEACAAEAANISNENRFNKAAYEPKEDPDKIEEIPVDFDKPPAYKVLIMGADGVGRSALIESFAELDDMEDIDTIVEQNQTTMTIWIDERETTLVFREMVDKEDHIEHKDADAYVILYAVTDKHTFHHAIDLLHDIADVISNQGAVILVGNKSDIVRQRQVTPEEGEDIARNYTCPASNMNNKPKILLKTREVPLKIGAGISKWSESRLYPATLPLYPA
ncbi:unnamed protein product [Owenia fusiformis]|uniref:Uncharacterized protein n=1 Tax=Owenia fusiformis TaxID=6347 RepID=A0A8J1Y841_OWEFU|nr:unnamed protein product [Owenia fusiformis]